MISFDGAIELILHIFKRSDWMNEEWVNKNMSIREARICLIFLAVSYTHLDVYKRQSYMRLKEILGSLRKNYIKNLNKILKK